MLLQNPVPCHYYSGLAPNGGVRFVGFSKTDYSDRADLQPCFHSRIGTCDPDWSSRGNKWIQLQGFKGLANRPAVGWWVLPVDGTKIGQQLRREQILSNLIQLLPHTCIGCTNEVAESGQVKDWSLCTLVAVETLLILERAMICFKTFVPNRNSASLDFSLADSKIKQLPYQIFPYFIVQNM